MKRQIEEWLVADFDSEALGEAASYGVDGRRIKSSGNSPW